MGNWDVDKAMQTLVEHGFIDKDGHPINIRSEYDLPSVTPKQRTGHWITVTNGRGGHECSLCHEYAPSYRNGEEWLTKYCPNCGCRMIEPQPKMGRWIYGEDNLGRDGWYCNQCEHFEFWDYSLDMKSAKLNLPNSCPNCMAKMEVEE